MLKSKGFASSTDHNHQDEHVSDNSKDRPADYLTDSDSSDSQGGPQDVYKEEESDGSTLQEETETETSHSTGDDTNGGNSDDSSEAEEPEKQEAQDPALSEPVEDYEFPDDKYPTSTALPPPLESNWPGSQEPASDQQPSSILELMLKPGTFHQFAAASSKQCMSINEHKNNVGQFGCWANDNNIWSLKQSGDGYVFQSKTGPVLTLSGSGLGFSNSPADAHIFKLTEKPLGAFTIQTKDGQCLTAEGAQEWGRIVLLPCKDEPTQLWSWEFVEGPRWPKNAPAKFRILVDTNQIKAEEVDPDRLESDGIWHVGATHAGIEKMARAGKWIATVNMLGKDGKIASTYEIALKAFGRADGSMLYGEFGMESSRDTVLTEYEINQYAKRYDNKLIVLSRQFSSAGKNKRGDYLRRALANNNTVGIVLEFNPGNSKTSRLWGYNAGIQYALSQGKQVYLLMAPRAGGSYVTDLKASMAYFEECGFYDHPNLFFVLAVYGRRQTGVGFLKADHGDPEANSLASALTYMKSYRSNFGSSE